MTQHTDYALHGRFLQGLAAAPRATALHLPTGPVSYEELHATALALGRGAGRRPGRAAPGGRHPRRQDPGVVRRACWPPCTSGRPPYRCTRSSRRRGPPGCSPRAGSPPCCSTRRGWRSGPSWATRSPGCRCSRRWWTRAAAAPGSAAAGGLGDAAGRAPPGRPGRRGVRAVHLRLDRAAQGGADHPRQPAALLLGCWTTGTTSGPDDRFSQSFDLNFDCAMFDLFCAWGAGASVHPVPPAAYRDVPAFVAERGLTVWFSTPSAITLVRRTGRLSPAAMPSLRWSFFAGEALHAADAVDWQAAAPGSTLENIYGPTELTVTITGHRWSPQTSPGLLRQRSGADRRTCTTGTTGCCSTPTARPARWRGTLHHRPAAHPRLPRPGRRRGPVPGPRRSALVPHRGPGPAAGEQGADLSGPARLAGAGARLAGGAGRDRARAARLPRHRGRGHRGPRRGRRHRAGGLLHR